MTTSAVIPAITFSGSSGSGTLGPFSLIKSGTPIYFTANSQIKVYRYDTTTDTAPTLLVEGTDYDLTGGPNAGSITLTSPQTGLLTAERLFVYREQPTTQTLDLITGGNFSAANLEARLDRTTEMIQELRREVQATVRFSLFDTDNIPNTLPLGAVIDKLFYISGTASAPTLATIDSPANLLANIQLTADNIVNINLVGSDLGGADTIGIVAADLDGDNTIGTVATNIANVNTVAGAIDAGSFSGNLAALAGLTIADGKIIRGTGADAFEVIDQDDIEVIATGSSAARTLGDRFRDTFNVLDHGALGDGSDDRSAIQAAIAAAEAAGGGLVIVPRGYTFSVGSSGISLGGREYALALADGVYITGGGTIARYGTDMDFTLIAGFGSGTFPSITESMGVDGITVDGKASTRIDGGAGTGSNGDGFSIWLFNVKNPVCRNIISLDAASFGVRIERCDGGSFVGNIKTDHGADVNADGVHFVDVRNITGHGFEVETEGDDGFILEASSFDVYNVTLTGVNVRSLSSGVTSARRGILILRDTSVSTTQLDLYNCKVEGVAYDCDYSGMVIQAGALDVYGCKFSVVAYSCRGGLLINAGDSLASGTVINNTFEVISHDSTQRGVVADLGSAGGTIDLNTIHARVYNPGDGYDGVYIDGGSRWNGSIIVDYDPNADKASQEDGISLLVTSSQLYLQCQDADRNIRLRSGCADNTIFLGHITGGITADIATSGATDAIFVGGIVDGTATGGCEFIGTVNQSTILHQQDFTDWTPTVSSSSGTITSYTVNYAEYKIIDGFLKFEVSVTIDDNGTGSGYLRITPPTTPARAGIGLARNTSSGATLYASWGVSAPNISLQTTGGGYPVATGQTVIFAGEYFVA